MSITKFLNKRGFYSFEGHTQCFPGKPIDLVKLTSKPNCKVLEIGFNAGHSAETFLKNNKTLKLTSFDLGSHPYVKVAKIYIDKHYPNRHRLIIGDSTVTIPKFIKNNKNLKFDVIFIDGCHQYDVANADLRNCVGLANRKTIVIIDDVVFNKENKPKYTIGPSKTWTEHLQKNKIVEIKRKLYGALGNNGMAWGRYKFK